MSNDSPTLSARLIDQCHRALSQLDNQITQDTDAALLLKILETCAKTAHTVSGIDTEDTPVDLREAGYAALLQQAFAGPQEQ